MAELPVMKIQWNMDGLKLVAEIISVLKRENDELQRSLIHVQNVSTGQVERIRVLEAELATIKTDEESSLP